MLRRTFPCVLSECTLSLPPSEREIVRDITEKLCCIGVDYGTELKSSAEKTHEHRRSSKFHWQRTPRHLFIMKCDVDNCKNLHTSVISSVGMTMCKVFLEFTTKEPTALVPSTMPERAQSWKYRKTSICWR